MKFYMDFLRVGGVVKDCWRGLDCRTGGEAYLGGGSLCLDMWEWVFGLCGLGVERGVMFKWLGCFLKKGG